MTKQDKELLLKDLCARLPYGVKFETKYNKDTPYELLAINKYSGIVETDKAIWWDLEDIRPYLRPMSSMTREEYKEYSELWDLQDKFPTDADIRFKTDVFDWLNAHYLDFRNLIPMGLALPAQEGMYNF